MGTSAQCALEPHMGHLLDLLPACAQVVASSDRTTPFPYLNNADKCHPLLLELKVRVI